MAANIMVCDTHIITDSGKNVSLIVHETVVEKVCAKMERATVK